MRSYINARLRRLVAPRAGRLCEYCLIHEDDTYLGCAVDHVISGKHGGRTTSANTAFACTFCNPYKGSDIGSVATVSGEFTRYFNPRRDRWADHFELTGATIKSLTGIDDVTVRILRLNNADRLAERRALMMAGRYPCERARQVARC